MMKTDTREFSAAQLYLSTDELVDRGGAKWIKYPPDIMPAWLADMDYLPSRQIRDETMQLAASGNFTYPLNAFLDRVRDSFGAYMNREYGCDIDVSRVTVLADVIQGLSAGIQAFSPPGGGVLMLSPSYPPFAETITNCKRVPILVPMIRGAEQFDIDFDLLAREAARPDVNLLLLCNPHNPTGRSFGETELRRLVEICARFDVTIVSDEIHSDLVYAPHRHVVLPALSPEAAFRTVSLHAASKAYNLGGLKCAVMYFGSQGLADQFAQQFPDKRVLGKAGRLSAAATMAAWDKSGAWLDVIRQQLQENRRSVYEWSRRLPEWVALYLPDSTYFAWIDFKALPRGLSAFDFLIENARVALSPGGDFGAGYSSWARLNFATSPQILDALLARIERAIVSAHQAAGEPPVGPTAIHHTSTSSVAPA